jgi:hypothetical protein
VSCMGYIWQDEKDIFHNRKKKRHFSQSLLNLTVKLLFLSLNHT